MEFSLEQASRHLRFSLSRTALSSLTIRPLKILSRGLSSIRGKSTPAKLLIPPVRFVKLLLLGQAHVVGSEGGVKVVGRGDFQSRG